MPYKFIIPCYECAHVSLINVYSESVPVNVEVKLAVMNLNLKQLQQLLLLLFPKPHTPPKMHALHLFSLLFTDPEAT